MFFLYVWNEKSNIVICWKTDILICQKTNIVVSCLHSFFHLIIEETIESMNVEFIPTYIRCLKKNCHGIIETAMHENMKDICWKCNNCTNSGIIKNVFGDWCSPLPHCCRTIVSCGLVVSLLIFQNCIPLAVITMLN